MKSENPWVIHLKKVRLENKDKKLSFSQLTKLAKRSYKK